MSLHLYLAYVAACIVLVIVPGPTVTLIVANSLRHGTRAGLLNIAGTQVGLALMIGIVLAGLASLIEAMGWWFDWVRLAGAAYLIWLGVKLLPLVRITRDAATHAQAARRLLPARLPRADKQSEGADSLWRALSAIH